MYALVDCNNFFVSCERAFQPELEGRPVVVLSNNDGCVVARSNESKAMGIKMGTPFFKVRYLVEQGRLVVRSSNYTLYGDLSARVMSILAEAAPRLEVYSIDEAYMDMDGVAPERIPGICSALVTRIRRGVCVIDSEEKILKALALTPIKEVWGIGRRGAPKLESVGVKTALDFIKRPCEWVRGMMGIGGVRTWSELQGRRMVEDERDEKRKSICTSRSFDKMVTDIDEMTLRVSDFAGKCAEKLRSDGTAAYSVGVFIQTNRFRDDLPQYFPNASVRLDVPANSTQEIVAAALRALRMVFRNGFEYKRAGVTVSDIVEADAIQTTLFDFDQEARDRDDRISKVMDLVNTSGKNLLRLATQRPGHYSDGIRREFCSRLYTTSWSELLEIK